MSLMLLASAATFEAKAQFTLSGQLRTRTELRNGLGNLVTKGSKAAAFTSQTNKTGIWVQMGPPYVWRIRTGRKGMGTGCFFYLQCRWQPLYAA